MTRTLAIAASLVLAAPRLAGADAALEEVSAGNAPQTSTTPGSNWLADRVAGMWEPSERWQIRGDFTGTRDWSGALSGTSLPNAPSDILLGALGIEFDPNEHWNTKLAATYSPNALTMTQTPVQAIGPTGKTVNANAGLDAYAASYGGSAQLGYDSAGDSAAEGSLLATASVTHFDVQQQITSIETKAGQMLTAQQVKDYCTAHRCSSQLSAALSGSADQLNQLVVGGNASMQLYQTTDVGLDGAYYFYDKDPTQVGYFSAASVGRLGLGAGAPIAPLQYTAGPDVMHRFGELMTLATVSYGKYVDGEGYNVTGALRVQYKWKLDRDKRIKLWGKLMGARDTDSTGAKSKSGSLALGMQYTW